MSKVIICILITLDLVLAQEPNVVWTKTFGGAMADKGYSIESTNDGGFIIAGETYSFGAGDNPDVYLIKTDCFGNVQWTRRFGTSGYDYGYCVRQTTDGGYIVVGEYNGRDIYLIKLNPAGGVQWWHSVDLDYQEYAQFICETTHINGYILVGGQSGPYDQGAVLLVRTDNLGYTIWTQTYSLYPYNDVGYCVQPIWDAVNLRYHYIITGRVYNPSPYIPSMDVWLFKVDSSGTLEWERRYGYSDWDEGRYVVCTSDGGYALNGTVRYGGGIFMWVIKTDEQGNIMWEKKLRPTPTSAARGYSLKQTSDAGYIAVGECMLTNVWDVYIVKLDKDGNIEWQKIVDRAGTNDHGYCMDIITENEYIITGATSYSGPPWYDVYLIKLGLMLYDTDDPLALAYNGNRHLVRKQNTEELHLVYTRMGSVIYQYSSNGGANWTAPLSIGTGKLPAITLSSEGLPSVTWTDSVGGLWYRRKINQNDWSPLYHLYDPWNIWQARLNSPPSIVITPHADTDSVHILVTLHTPANGPQNWVAEYAFRITNPITGVFLYIEGGAGQYAGPIRSYPSIARSPNNSLHAVWQRGDTICYATRQVGQAWQNWGPQFQQWGIQSAHPFVETYGDMVYVVWEHGSPAEVYKGENWIYNSQPQFVWDNLSRTPNTLSRYPVNASGTFTVFQDSPWPPINGPEIYYKVHPEDEPYNISHTLASSRYPQSVARLLGDRTFLYTAWVDGDDPAYEIRFKKISYIPMEIAYLTSPNGSETPSPYLVQRDSFISTWQVPVDIGYQTITYQFPLESGYRYKMKVIAYHEFNGQWREWVKIDNRWKHLIKYNAYKPETLEFWIPPAFSQDGKIEVVFDKISGSFATAGPIYVYQYEYEEEATELASGPMGQESRPLNSSAITILPNPFTEKVEIKYYLPKESPQVTLKIYDITGRLIKKLYDGPAINDLSIIWRGRDENERIVARGVYFLQLQDVNANVVLCRKILKVE